MSVLRELLVAAERALIQRSAAMAPPARRVVAEKRAVHLKRVVAAKICRTMTVTAGAVEMTVLSRASSVPLAIAFRFSNNCRAVAKLDLCRRSAATVRPLAPFQRPSGGGQFLVVRFVRSTLSEGRRRHILFHESANRGDREVLSPRRQH